MPNARMLLLRLALLSLALSGTAAAQASAPKPIFDDAWLRAVVARVLPEVERACGRRFKQPPTVGLADAGDVMRALRDELGPPLAVFYKGQPRARIDKAVQLRADMAATSLLGKYGFESREVYVLPHLVAFHLGVVHRNEAPLDQVLQHVVVHELVHALQDQEIGLGKRLRDCVDSDANEAFAMLIEGHAVFCSERAAKALGLEAAVEPQRAIFVGDKDPTTIQKADLATRRLRGMGNLLYLRSALFLEQQFETGGHDRLWALLAQPQPCTRQLLVAGSAEPTACASLAASFDGIDARLAGANWTVGRGRLTDRMLMGESLPRGDELAAMLPSLAASGEWLAFAPTPASWRALYLLSFNDAQVAERFCALAEDVASTDMVGSPLVFVAEPWPSWEGVVARRLTQAPKSPFPPAASAQLLWYRHGRHVLQATFCNAPVDDDVLTEVARTLLSRLP